MQGWNSKARSKIVVSCLVCRYVGRVRVWPNLMGRLSVGSAKSSALCASISPNRRAPSGGIGLGTSVLVYVPA